MSINFNLIHVQSSRSDNVAAVV